MVVIEVDFASTPPNGPPYLEGRDPDAVLQQMLDTELADGKTVGDVARLAKNGDVEAAIRLGFLGLQVEGCGVRLISPALFSKGLPVVYEKGGLHAFHALGAMPV